MAWLFQRYIKPGEGKLFLAEDTGEGQLSLLLVILDHHHGGLAWLGNHREDSGWWIWMCALSNVYRGRLRTSRLGTK